MLKRQLEGKHALTSFGMNELILLEFMARDQYYVLALGGNDSTLRLWESGRENSVAVC